MMNNKYTKNDEYYTTYKIWEDIVDFIPKDKKKYGNVFIPATLNQQITYGILVSRSYGKMLIFLHTTTATF